MKKNDSIKQRQLRIFRILMYTRANKVSYEHVQALNAIDLEFYSESGIIQAWKNYLEHLNKDELPKDKLNAWGDKGNDLFADLLNKMAEFLGYKFDITHLKQGIYLPKAHVDQEQFQNFIKENVTNILTGSQPIPIKVIQPAGEDALKNSELRDSMIEFFSSKKTIDN